MTMTIEWLKCRLEEELGSLAESETVNYELVLGYSLGRAGYILGLRHVLATIQAEEPEEDNEED